MAIEGFWQLVFFHPRAAACTAQAVIGVVAKGEGQHVPTQLLDTWPTEKSFERASSANLLPEVHWVYHAMGEVAVVCSQYGTPAFC